MSRVDMIIDGDVETKANYSDPEDVVLEIKGVGHFQLESWQHVKIHVVSGTHAD